MTLRAFENPNHEGNSAKHHTGKECITDGRTNLAGTLWSHLWCFECNVIRMRKIDNNLNGMLDKFPK